MAVNVLNTVDINLSNCTVLHSQIRALYQQQPLRAVVCVCVCVCVCVRVFVRLCARGEQRCSTLIKASLMNLVTDIRLFGPNFISGPL